MKPNEWKLLQDYVRKRYSEVSLDYQTFEEDIDDTLTYLENKRIITEYCDKILPKVVPKLKRDADTDKQKEKEMIEAMMKAEQEKQAEKTRIEIEKDLKKNPSIDFIKDKIEREFIPFEKGEKNLLYICGSQGTSKTTSLRHIFLERGYKEDIDYVFLGYTPASKLFEKFNLFNNKGVKFIIMDDAQGIFKSDTSRGMFLQAVDDKKIRNIYYDGGIKPLPPILDFKPKVIFISNEMITYENILSRARVVQILLNYEKRLKYASEVLKNKGASEEEITLIVQHLKEKTEKKKIPFDFRICRELLEDCRFNPKWKEKTILDERTTILIQCLENSGTKEAIKNWTIITGQSERTGYYVLKGMDRI